MSMTKANRFKCRWLTRSAADLDAIARFRYHLACDAAGNELPSVSRLQLLMQEQRCAGLSAQDLVPRRAGCEDADGTLVGLMEVRRDAALPGVVPAVNLKADTLPLLRQQGVCTRLHDFVLPQVGTGRAVATIVPTAPAIGVLSALQYRQHPGWHRLERLYRNDLRGLLALPDLFGFFREVLDGPRLVGLWLGERRDFLLRRAGPDDLGPATQLRLELALLLEHLTHWEPIECGTANILTAGDEQSQLYVIVDTTGVVVGTARVVLFWNFETACFEVQVRDVVFGTAARGQGLLGWLYPGLLHFSRTVLHGNDVYSWFTCEHEPVLLSTWVKGDKLLGHYRRELNLEPTAHRFCENS